MNNEKFDLVAQPFILDGITYIPVRDLSNIYGFRIEYIDKYGIIEIEEDGSILILSKRGAVRKYKDSIQDINSKFIIRDNRACVPLRLVMEGQKLKVEYIKETNQIKITGKVSAVSRKKFPILSSSTREVIEAVNNTFESAKYDFNATIKRYRTLDDNHGHTKSMGKRRHQ